METTTARYALESNGMRDAVACLHTSSAANVGTDKDSEKRQRAAIDTYAKRAGFGRSDFIAMNSSRYREAAAIVNLR